MPVTTAATRTEAFRLHVCRTLPDYNELSFEYNAAWQCCPHVFEFLLISPTVFVAVLQKPGETPLWADRSTFLDHSGQLTEVG